MVNLLTYFLLFFFFLQFINSFTDGNASLVNLSSVIFCLSVYQLVIKKILLPTDLLMEQTRKKKLPASFRRYIPRKIPSVILLVII